MREQKVFIAEDGRRFDSKDSCLLYEHECERIGQIMSKLEPRPDDTSFTNGNLGYIQQRVPYVYQIRAALLRFWQKSSVGFEHNWILETVEDEVGDKHSSWAARLVTEGDHKAFNNAMYRFQCIDKQGREWGQPFYAENPDRATVQTCLNQIHDLQNP